MSDHINKSSAASSGMKTVYFVRHGESETNAGGIILGGKVTTLTELGREQARFVAERVSKLPIEVIISSPYLRTKQTAEIIAERIKLPIEFCDSLYEWNRGQARIGKPATDPVLKERDNEMIAHLDEEGWRMDDAENFEDLDARAAKSLEFLRQRPENNLLVVGHGLFTRILIGKAIMGTDYTGRDCRHLLRSLKTQNTGITVLRYKSDDTWNPWQLITWNDHAHLG